VVTTCKGWVLRRDGHRLDHAVRRSRTVIRHPNGGTVAQQMGLSEDQVGIGELPTDEGEIDCRGAVPELLGSPYG